MLLFSRHCIKTLCRKTVQGIFTGSEYSMSLHKSRLIASEQFDDPVKPTVNNVSLASRVWY